MIDSEWNSNFILKLDSPSYFGIIIQKFDIFPLNKLSILTIKKHCNDCLFCYVSFSSPFNRCKPCFSFASFRWIDYFNNAMENWFIKSNYNTLPTSINKSDRKVNLSEKQSKTPRFYRGFHFYSIKILPNWKNDGTQNMRTPHIATINCPHDFRPKTEF